MTRRFKVFVALNLAGFIGLAVWLRRDIPPPDPGDLVMAEEIVPEEDNALPHYTRLVEHYLATQASVMDAEGRNMLRLALSKQHCQRSEDDISILDGRYRSEYFLHQVVLEEFKLIHDREVLTHNWPGTLSNLQDQARFSRHMEEFSLRDGITTPMLKSRHDVVQSVQQLAMMTWAEPDELEAVLKGIPPISKIFPAFARHYYTDCEIMLTDMTETESLLQFNRTRDSLIRFMQKQRLASSTPLNSSVHAEINREIQTHQNMLLNQGKFRVLWSPNYNGEGTLNYLQRDWLAWPRQRCLMDTRLNLIRTLVACLRYQRDHGNLPPRLEDLAPAYLPSVPLDAYDGLPLGYDPASGLLFSRWPLKQDGKPELGEDVLTKTPTIHPARANDSTVLQIPPSPP